MGRFAAGSISSGGSITFSITVTTVFNPSGDWGNDFALAHPRDPGVTLRSDLHGKRLNPTGRFSYFVTVAAFGPSGSVTRVDIDF